MAAMSHSALPPSVYSASRNRHDWSYLDNMDTLPDYEDVVLANQLYSQGTQSKSQSNSGKRQSHNTPSGNRITSDLKWISDVLYHPGIHIVGFFLIGTATALLHHFIYLSLNNTKAGDKISWKLALFLGLLLSHLTKSCWTAVLHRAHLQRAFLTMHTTPLSLNAIDALLDSQRRLSSFTNFEALRYGKITMLLAGISRLLPLPILLTPLSLTITPTPSTPSNPSQTFTYHPLYLYTTYLPLLLLTLLSIPTGLYAQFHSTQLPNARFSTLLRACQNANVQRLGSLSNWGTLDEGWGRVRLVLRAGREGGGRGVGDVRVEEDEEIVRPMFVLGNGGGGVGVVRYC